jgi:acyl-CoA thioesterase II
VTAGAIREASLADLFDVTDAWGCWRAGTKAFGTPVTFGGQLIGLAVLCAMRSAGADFSPTCVQAQMLDAGRAGSAVDIAAANVREGRGSRHRHVVVSQDGRDLAHVAVILERPRDDEVADQSVAAPVLPGPDAIEDRSSPFVTRWSFDEVDVRHASRADSLSLHPVWVRPRRHLPDSPEVHAAALAFVSDMGLVVAAARDVDLHTTVPVTVDHTVWLHGPARFDDWLLLDAGRVIRTGDRALVGGSLFAADGRLVATIAQGVRLRAGTRG